MSISPSDRAAASSPSRQPCAPRLPVGRSGTSRPFPWRGCTATTSRSSISSGAPWWGSRPCAAVGRARRWRRALELFAAARRSGRLLETDWACRRAALRGARDAGLRAPLKLFVNVEPAALGGEAPERMAGLTEEVLRDLDIVVEFTERAIAESPAELLRAINRVRQLGGSVAIDDVGTGPAPLAIVPLVRPDVVKLDLTIVQPRPRASRPRSRPRSAPTRRPPAPRSWPRAWRPRST